MLVVIVAVAGEYFHLGNRDFDFDFSVIISIVVVISFYYLRLFSGLPFV